MPTVNGMTLRLLLATCLCILTSQAANAEESGYFFGADIGAAVLGFDNGDFGAQYPNTINSIDEHDTGYKFFGGYNFNENWAIEVGYVNAGRFENKWYGPGGGGLFNNNIYTFDYKADAWFAAVKGAFPITENLGLFGKIGATLNRAQDTFTLDRSRHIEPPLVPCIPLGSKCYPDFSNSSTFFRAGDYESTHWDMLLGVGVEYRAFERTSLRLEYERFGEFGSQGDVGRATLSLWSFGITYKFP